MTSKRGQFSPICVGDKFEDARGRWWVTMTSKAPNGRVALNIRREGGGVGSTFADVVHAKLLKGTVKVFSRGVDPDTGEPTPSFREFGVIAPAPTLQQLKTWIELANEKGWTLDAQGLSIAIDSKTKTIKLRPAVIGAAGVPSMPTEATS